MKTLRSLGIAALLSAYLFKVQHWPGAHLLALSGFIMATFGIMLPVLRNRSQVTAGDVLRPLMAVLFYASGLMYLLNVPGGSFVFHSFAVVTTAFLLSDRTRFELSRPGELRALPLLIIALVLATGGVTFKVMHWPTASVQLMLGVGCAVAWMLIHALHTPKTTTKPTLGHS